MRATPIAATISGEDAAWGGVTEKGFPQGCGGRWETDMLYRAAFEFGVTRRVEWADDLAAFHGHVDRVREHIEARAKTAEVRIMADIGQSCLTLDFLIEAPHEASAQEEALEIVSLAIRECGARHTGLFPFGEESRLRSKLNAFSGLRTPLWSQRRILIAEAA